MGLIHIFEFMKLWWKKTLPDLSLYWQVTLNTVIHRISLCGRSYERCMERDYIELLW